MSHLFCVPVRLIIGEYLLYIALVTVGFSVPTVSVLEGVGLVTVCIKKSADTIVPVTVSAELVPLTANFETGCNHNISICTVIISVVVDVV